MKDIGFYAWALLLSLLFFEPGFWLLLGLLVILVCMYVFKYIVGFVNLLKDNS